MSLAVRQITKALTETYKAVIDMSDLPTPQQDSPHFLSRALAAFFIEKHSALAPAEITKLVTDSYNDNGIDAVYFDTTTKRLYLVQSKFIQSGNGGPDLGDVAKFCNGVRLLLNTDFASFSTKFKPHLALIESALDDANTDIVVALVTTGDSFSDHAKAELGRLRDEVNNPIELITLQLNGIADVHSWLRDATASKDIEFELMLREWGTTQEPLVSFYGQVSCIELVDAYLKHRHHLLTQNIRKFLGDTEINDAISATAVGAPDQFIFHSNGVVILCESVAKTAKGGSNRDAGTFICKGAQVVNGAQTIGALTAAADRDRAAVSSARLLVRIIEVPPDQRDLASRLTKSTNTQNRVDKKDFVTLDPRHDQLRIDLALDGVEYIFKSGDKPRGDVHFSIEEGISALACLSGNIEYAINAKKEIGKLWERTDAPPYTELFSPSLTGERLWRAVQMSRRIEQRLAPRSRPAGDERNLAVHGSKIAQHIVFSIMDPAIKNDHRKSFDAEIDSKTDAVFTAMVAARAAKFADGYLGRMFYNITKTKAFVDETKASVSALRAPTSSPVKAP
jgi:hypothetical protein